MIIADSQNRRFNKAFRDTILNPKKEQDVVAKLLSQQEKSQYLLFSKYLTKPTYTKLIDTIIARKQGSKLLLQKKELSLFITEDNSHLTEELRKTFKKVVPIVGTILLPEEELLEALNAENKYELAIGAKMDEARKYVIITKGDLSTMLIPFKYIKNTSKKIAIGKLKLIDCGQTLDFDGYEVAFDAILYDLDQEYRKRLLKKRKAEDRSFGACLKRLRVAQRLKQSNFQEITEKEIGRIERGEVKKPHQKTIQKILNVLGVDEETLLTY
ncbi:MAG: helix-turn-helix transcriptional regulator [Spirochaetota bacterium]